METVYSYQINHLPVQTGDILCTTDGGGEILPGEFWRLIGKLLPGDVDHIALYLGPGGRCIESGALGVITFDVEGGIWDGVKMSSQRGLLIDTLYGVAYPLAKLKLPGPEEQRIRAAIAAFCLAQIGKPYNVNFFNLESEHAYYCSQLAYKAYQPHGINLNAGMSIPALPGTEGAIYPQEIWEFCPHLRTDQGERPQNNGILPAE